MVVTMDKSDRNKTYRRCPFRVLLVHHFNITYLLRGVDAKVPEGLVTQDYL